jgi:hypothetical protein
LAVIYRVDDDDAAAALANDVILTPSSSGILRLSSPGPRNPSPAAPTLRELYEATLAVKKSAETGQVVALS